MTKWEIEYRETAQENVKFEFWKTMVSFHNLLLWVSWRWDSECCQEVQSQEWNLITATVVNQYWWNICYLWSWFSTYVYVFLAHRMCLLCKLPWILHRKRVRINKWAKVYPKLQRTNDSHISWAVEQFHCLLKKQWIFINSSRRSL